MITQSREIGLCDANNITGSYTMTHGKHNTPVQPVRPAGHNAPIVPVYDPELAAEVAAYAASVEEVCEQISTTEKRSEVKVADIDALDVAALAAFEVIKARIVDANDLASREQKKGLRIVESDLKQARNRLAQKSNSVIERIAGKSGKRSDWTRRFEKPGKGGGTTRVSRVAGKCYSVKFERAGNPA